MLKETNDKLETCKRTLNVKTNEAQIIKQDMVDKKSTISKLTEGLKDEQNRNYQCQSGLEITVKHLTECKKSEDELAKLRIENAVYSKSKSSDLMPTVMSQSETISEISSTNDKLSATNTQQSETIAQLTSTIAHLSATIKQLSSTGNNEKE